MATKALIKPELLVWTRNRAKVSVEDAAKAANVTAGDIETWVAGSRAPSLNQLRCLAAKYHFPLAFLPTGTAGRLRTTPGFPPTARFRRPKHHGQLGLPYPHGLRATRTGSELQDDLREEPRIFPLRAKLDDDPDAIGIVIRDFLGVDDEAQKKRLGPAGHSISGAASWKRIR